MPTETRYMRSDLWADDVYKLLLAQTGVGNLFRFEEVGDTTGIEHAWGIRVFKGSGAEITAGTPVAVVTRTGAGSGVQSATWSCPLTSLLSTDTVVVRVYGRVSPSAAWFLFIDLTYLTAEFRTEALGAQSLDAATWTVYYYTYLAYIAAINKTRMQYHVDTATYLSRIEGFTWTPAPTAAAHAYCDGFVCIISLLKKLGVAWAAPAVADADPTLDPMAPSQAIFSPVAVLKPSATDRLNNLWSLVCAQTPRALNHVLHRQVDDHGFNHRRRRLLSFQPRLHQRL